MDTPTDGQPTDDFATIPDVPIPTDTQRVSPNQIASGVARGIQQFGSDQVYVDSGNNQFVVADSTSPRVVMGNQATFGEGFYVSKSGIDATTNTDPTQWIFNSNQDVFKIIKTDVITESIDLGVGGTTFTIPHNLGFVPTYDVYWFNPLFGGQYHKLPHIAALTVGTPPTATMSINIVSEAYVDSNNLYISWIQGNATGIITLTFRYYLLQETAAVT